jgi:hypothetical protein
MLPHSPKPLLLSGHCLQWLKILETTCSAEAGLTPSNHNQLEFKLYAIKSKHLISVAGGIVFGFKKKKFLLKS